MKISVAMATYNGEAFIREQLASLAGQTHPPHELIVSDDGSSDRTLRMVAEFKDAAPFPVMILPQEQRLGFENNFLRACETCVGDFIATCDQDDIWLPAKLETCARRLREDDGVIALHTMTLIDAEARPIGYWAQHIEENAAFEPLHLAPYLNGWGNSMVFLKELVHLFPRDARPRQPESPHRSLSHDTWIYMLAAALGRVSHIAAPLILYRQHGNNALGVTEKRTRSRWRAAGDVPMLRWREEAKIGYAMSELFVELAARPGPFAERARLAADTTLRRARTLTARADTFEDASVRARLRAYRAFNQASDWRPGLPYRIKALALGVAGLHRLAARRGEAPQKS